MAQEVRIVSRTLMDTPTVDNPLRKVMMVQYQVGELPPGFVYIKKEDYTKEAEAAAIKADVKKRMEKPQETITI